ncbi:hypothetical protein R3P38DRAFT_3225845 [Favolaschia claudopus]|uniref:Uncharacterized protein n=1 Tax=Favolaschia claudopus TaxID=2862362 RepID=A0AAV9ZVK8_9AGAR
MSEGFYLQLQVGSQSPERDPGLVYPDPNGHPLPAEDAEELARDPGANDDEEDEEDEEEEGEVGAEGTDEESDELESSPLRPPPQIRQPLPSQSFASTVPLRLPPHPEDPQVGGGYKRREASPLPPDQQPATRFRQNITPSKRAGPTAKALHVTRRAQPSLPGITAIASTSAADPPAPPLATSTPQHRPEVNRWPPPQPPPRAPLAADGLSRPPPYALPGQVPASAKEEALKLFDSPSKLARSTSIEPAKRRLAAKSPQRASSAVPTFPKQFYTKKQLQAKRKQAQELAALQQELADTILPPPPPPSSNMWEDIPIPPPPDAHSLPPPPEGTGDANAHINSVSQNMDPFNMSPSFDPSMPLPEASAEASAPPAEAFPGSTNRHDDPASLFETDENVVYGHRSPSPRPLDDGTDAESHARSPSANFSRASSVVDSEARGPSLSAIDNDADSGDEADSGEDAEVETLDAVQSVGGDVGGRLSDEQGEVVKEYLTEVKQLIQVYQAKSGVTTDRLSRILVNDLSHTTDRRTGPNFWNIYQALATDPRFAVAEYQRYDKKFKGSFDDLPQTMPLNKMYTLFKAAKQDRAGEALLQYSRLADLDRMETLATRGRQFKQFCETLKVKFQEMSDKKFNAIAFVIGSHVSEDGELGNVIATPALAEAFSNAFKHPVSGKGYSNSDLLGVAKTVSYNSEMVNVLSKGTVLPIATTSADPSGAASASQVNASAGPSNASAGPSARPTRASAATSAVASTSAAPSAPSQVVVKTEEKGRHVGGTRAKDLDWRSATGQKPVPLPNEPADTKWLHGRWNEMSEGIINERFFSKTIRGDFPWLSLFEMLQKAGLRLVGWPNNVRLPGEKKKGNKKGMAGWRMKEVTWFNVALVEWSKTGYGLRLQRYTAQDANTDYFIICHDYTLVPPTEPNQLDHYWSTCNNQRVRCARLNGDLFEATIDLRRPGNPAITAARLTGKEDSSDEEGVVEVAPPKKKKTRKAKAEAAPAKAAPAKADKGKGKAVEVVEDDSDTDDDRPLGRGAMEVDDHNGLGYIDPDDAEYVDSSEKKSTKSKRATAPKATTSKRTRGPHASPTSSDFFLNDTETGERPPKKTKASVNPPARPAANVQQEGGGGAGSSSANASAVPSAMASAGTSANSRPRPAPRKVVTFNAPASPASPAPSAALSPQQNLANKLAQQAGRMSNWHAVYGNDSKTSAAAEDVPPQPQDVPTAPARRTRSATAAAEKASTSTKKKTKAKASTKASAKASAEASAEVSAEGSGSPETVIPAYIRQSPPPHTHYKGVMYTTDGEAMPMGHIVAGDGPSANYLIPHTGTSNPPPPVAPPVAPSVAPPPPTVVARPPNPFDEYVELMTRMDEVRASARLPGNDFKAIMGEYAALKARATEIERGLVGGD